MIAERDFDVIVLGAGPAGLAAALASRAAGARTALVEREERLGGILKQCVHDGFGLLRFGEQLSGPEYALRFARELPGAGVEVFLETFVHAARRLEPEASAGHRLANSEHSLATGETRFSLDCVNRREGALRLGAKALVLATGCRERSDRQVLIQGERPAGIMTAGLAQHLVNIEGLLPGKRAVVLGSGDIGLIMARRLSLEGMEVEGVYEIKGEPSGLSRNLSQCLDDFGIPLHLSTTVTSAWGKRRLESVELASVDERGSPIAGTERRVDCDTLVLSVGLIPENELALSLGLSLDPATKGPRVDQGGASEAEGVYVCGNALHVNDLVDYVSESGEAAGASAASFALSGPPAGGRVLVPLRTGPGFLYALPQAIDLSRGGKSVLYFRSAATLREGARLSLSQGGRTILKKRYAALRPPEMERIEIENAALEAHGGWLSLSLEAGEA